MKISVNFQIQFVNPDRLKAFLKTVKKGCPRIEYELTDKREYRKGEGQPCCSIGCIVKHSDLEVIKQYKALVPLLTECLMDKNVIELYFELSDKKRLILLQKRPNV